jgi:hypothetical protein
MGHFGLIVALQHIIISLSLYILHMPMEFECTDFKKVEFPIALIYCMLFQRKIRKKPDKDVCY